MRILMITMSLCAVLGSSHMAYADTPTAAFTLENVGDGVYVHHGLHLDIDTGYQGDICNASFVVGSRGVAVIDTGGSLKVGKQLLAAIRSVTPLPVLYVINTHVHPDHIYGNAAFLPSSPSEPKPEFVGHEKLAHMMDLRSEQYAKLNARFLHDDAIGSELVRPTLSVKTTLNLDLGDRQLQLTAHPVAHTNTDVSVIDTKTATLFTGDLLFIERTPVVEGDIKGLIAEVAALKNSQAKLVVPGHGPVTKDWQAALDKSQHYLTVLLADIRSGIKNNDGMEKTMDKAAASEKDKWLLFEIANRRNVNTLYPALEWE